MSQVTYTIKHVKRGDPLPARIYTTRYSEYSTAESFRSRVLERFSGKLPKANTQDPDSPFHDDLWVMCVEENPCPEYGEVCY